MWKLARHYKKTKKKRAVLIVEANVLTTLTCAQNIKAIILISSFFIVQLNCQIRPKAWKKLELPLVLWLARRHFWLFLVNDLVRRWLSQTLAHWASEFKSYLPQKKICSSEMSRWDFFWALRRAVNPHVLKYWKLIRKGMKDNVMMLC